ncbi:MAG: alpha-galactosidase [Nitrososphaerota archaeon]|nr:alpha-galactosidase [Candidatus Calditenuaceae archaeon]MDW8073722.1 alpha-galactosidase [Nitrososphaerota archaeon]
MATIEFSSREKLWSINAGALQYLLKVADDGSLINVHCGGRVGPAETFRLEGHFPFEPGLHLLREEYSTFGGLRFMEPCLKAELPGGIRDCVLKYVGHSITDSRELAVTLGDIGYSLQVELHYRAYPEYNLISRWAIIRNAGQEAVTLEEALSGAVSLPRRSTWRLGYLAGHWAGETRVVEEELKAGKKVLESRRGTTSHQLNPALFLDSGDAVEEDGEVWGCLLAWSGNWKAVAEYASHDQLRLYMGVNDFDFSWHLAPGESFTTPKMVVAYSSEGFGGLSRSLHRFERREVLPKNHADKPRPVIYNTWETLYFNVNEENLKTLAERAAEIGVEIFVVDDGWFRGRNDDRAGLGDWEPDPSKFPRGLGPVIEHVKSLGMKFGIWVEPENVNPNSDLYRRHPDWVYHFPGRPRSEMRNQLVLNLCRSDVREYVFGWLDRLLTENDIGFVKWDMNRNFSEPGWPDAPRERQREIWVRHVLAIYDILDELRRRHPDVVFEGCSGGGGRVDLGAMERYDQFWTSDNTDALDRLYIQEGYTMAYCPKTMGAWVTGVPNFLTNRSLSLEFRFHSAMMGALGVSVNLLELSKQEIEEAKMHIEFYKKVRHIVQDGDLYRLRSPRCGGLAAFQYVTPDKAESLLFLFSLQQGFGERIANVTLRGLDPDFIYELDSSGQTLTGALLMNYGIDPALRGDYKSRIIHFKAKR